jgi:protein-tyrosine kinase
MEQSQFDFTQQIMSLWRNKGKILLVGLIAGGIALILVAMRVPIYNATATLIVGNTEQRLAAVPSDVMGGLNITYLQDIGTQIEVMKSRAVLEQTIALLEPDKANDPNYLQEQADMLSGALTISQVEATNMVTITVASTDPALAQEQANAVAEAYVNQTQTVTNNAIEGALEDTTKQLVELQKASIDLSINPLLAQLTTQINTGLPALQSASAQLQGLLETDNATGEPPLTENTDIVLTAQELGVIQQMSNAVSSEATAIADLIHKLNPVSDEVNFNQRSSSIAVIESRVRALTTNIDSLYLEVATAQQAETDAVVKEDLRAIGEQLQVASDTASAILEQVISLYNIQAQYIAAISSETPDQGVALNREADANLLYRIFEHTNILTETLDSAPEQAAQITPRAVVPEQWRLQVLGSQIDAAIAILQQIKQKLEPGSPNDNVILTRTELLDMEIQAQTITNNLDSSSSQLATVRSDTLDPQVITVLVNIQDSLNTASYAASGMEDEITSLAETGSDSSSYTALDTLRQQLQLALLSSDTSSTRIVDTALVSSVEGIFTRYKSVILAFIAGLLISALAILIIQYYDRTVRDASQVKRQLGLRLMANINMAKDGKLLSLSALDKVSPKYLESFRLLRTNLGLDCAHGKVLLVSSPQAGEGKTTVAVNLAMVVALQGMKVLLIDGNLRHPDIAAILDLADGEGLSEFLTREDEEKSYIIEAENVYILPGGTPSVISAEILSSPRLKELLEKARQNYDVIIIDSAAVMDWADTRILARNADGVLIVLHSNHSNLDLARESKQVLESVGAHVEGFVLSDTAPAR